MDRLYYCYVIQVGRYIKIGYTSDPEKRLETISTHSPIKPRTICMFSYNTEDAARECEQSLHGKLKKYRKNGEWFEKGAVKKFLRMSGKIIQ